MNIYDCFIFFNEIELLEIRLNILNEYVDYFVFVQSIYTFTGVAKEIIDIKSLPFYNQFKEKIIYKLDMIIPMNNAWDNEHRQRNLLKDMINPEDNDIVIVSDIDEIPDLRTIKLNEIENEKLYGFYQTVSYYFLDTIFEKQEQLTMLCKGDYFKNATPQKIRESRYNCDYDLTGGWHFSYLGGLKTIQKKLKAFSHTEYSNIDDNIIINAINNLIDLFDRGDKLIISETKNLPEYIRDNLDKYKHLIRGKK